MLRLFQAGLWLAAPLNPYMWSRRETRVLLTPVQLAADKMRATSKSWNIKV